MNSNKKTARSEENKAIIRRLIEAENKRNPALLDEFLAPDFVTSDLTDTPEETQGREILKQSCAQMYKGFPDWHGTIEDIIAEGDKVWVRYKGTGTHKGEYLGLAPTGKKVTMNSFIYHLSYS
jgi:predicted ester cyclase